MVLTRLRVGGTTPKHWGKLSLPQVRRWNSSVSALSDPLFAKQTDDSNPGPTRPTKSKRAFADLPKVFIGANGIAAAPLPDWNPSYIVPPPPVEQNDTAKPKRKPRKKKEIAETDVTTLKPAKTVTKGGETLFTTKRLVEPNQDSVASGSTSRTKVVESANKAPKPTSFLAREILSNLRRFPHCILLTRVGNFYESYFDQAVEVAKLLNIKLTSRKWNGERVAMCGFPIPHLDRYLKVLVQQQKRSVAMCEEFPRYGSDGVKEFDRRVSRIITPGTLIDESFVNPSDNNYLLAIAPSEAAEAVGLAWIDVSTGEFFSKQCEVERLADELARLSPREIVLDKTLQELKDNPILSTIGKTDYLVSYLDTANLTANSGASDVPPTIPQEEATTSSNIVLSRIQSKLRHDLDKLPSEETSAVSLLTKFLQDHLREHMPVLNAPQHEGMKDRMQIDAHTIQALEIRESAYEGGTAKGSLVSVVKRTTTTGGTRLLSRWLCSPSTSVSEISARQSLVAFFHRRPHFRTDVREILREMEDVGRLCQRFLLGKADISDLMEINSTITTWDTLKQRCKLERTMEMSEGRLVLDPAEWQSVEALFSQMTDLGTLSKRISDSIIENLDGEEGALLEEDDAKEVDDANTARQDSPDERQQKLYSINPSSSKKLSQLHGILADLLQQKDKLEIDLREKHDAPSLTLRSANSQGMYIHLSRAKRDRKKIDEDPDFCSMSESITTKSYFYRDWSLLGAKINDVTVAMGAAEKEVFDILRLEVIDHSSLLRANAHVIDELDVAVSFAVLAGEMNLVRPEVVEDLSYEVINGRHPSVEMGLLSSGRQFVPNSVQMDPSSSLHIITGPNMAGKSTFLRQTALIAILAQVGSFVPADSARVGIVDKVFSRIGARDDLYRDRSTFMIEMLETADILRGATDRSLIIMDEVGRGTTVKDGLAIAFSALHYLATVSRSRCLFATHFHELAEMMGNDKNLRGSGIFSAIRFYCSDVHEVEDGYFAYSYRLQPGINRDSHGLKVARLAGIQPSAMDVATKAHTWLHQNGTDKIQENYLDFLHYTCNIPP